MLVNRRDKSDWAMTLDALRDWVSDRKEGSYYCPMCLTDLAPAEDDERGHFYCPNEFCRDNTEWVEDGKEE